MHLNLLAVFHGTSTFSNGTVLDRTGGCITLSSITKLFSGELKLRERAENALTAGRLISFMYDGTNRVIKAAVQSSMKKGS